MAQTRTKRLASGIDESDTAETSTSEAAQLAKRRKLVKTAVSHNEHVLGPNGKNVLTILLRKDNLYPVHQSLTTHLDIMDIIRLTRTCKALSNLYQDLRQSSWDIDSYLTRWFNNPRSLRLRVAEHGAVLGGTAIYDFMNRRDRDDAIVEVFVGGYCRNREDYRPGSGQYHFWPQYYRNNDHFITLLETEGYTVMQTQGIETDMLGWSRAVSFAKKTGTRSERVNLIFPGHYRDGLEWIINQTRSTACLNLLFWERCVSIFPNATFNKKIAFNVGPNRGWSPIRDPADLHLKSWLDRGLGLPSDQLVNVECGLTISDPWKRCRRIAGPEAWQITFDTRTAERSLPPSWVLDTAYMSLRVGFDRTSKFIYLYTFKELLPVSRFPIFTSYPHQDQTVDKLCTMWHQSYLSMSVSHTLLKYECLKNEERHRRRSPRLEIENLDDIEKRKAHTQIYSEITMDMNEDRWKVPSGWYDDEVISQFWEKCKAKLEDVIGEKAESREMELSKSAAAYIPGLN